MYKRQVELSASQTRIKTEKSNFENKVVNEKQDELGILVTSFKQMRDSINQSIAIIESHNATLEAHVKERTDALERSNQRLKYLSEHDPLTGLPNRSVFDEQMEELLTEARVNCTSFAVASIDLRKFKSINDTFCLLYTSPSPRD